MLVSITLHYTATNEFLESIYLNFSSSFHLIVANSFSFLFLPEYVSWDSHHFRRNMIKFYWYNYGICWNEEIFLYSWLEGEECRWNSNVHWRRFGLKYWRQTNFWRNSSQNQKIRNSPSVKAQLLTKTFSLNWIKAFPHLDIAKIKTDFSFHDLIMNLA